MPLISKTKSLLPVAAAQGMPPTKQFKHSIWAEIQLSHFTVDSPKEPPVELRSGNPHAGQISCVNTETRQKCKGQHAWPFHRAQRGEKRDFTGLWQKVKSTSLSCQSFPSNPHCMQASKKSSGWFIYTHLEMTDFGSTMQPCALKRFQALPELTILPSTAHPGSREILKTLS